MFATKTKKVASYGRRAQRFVAVSEGPSSRNSLEDDATSSSLATSKYPGSALSIKTASSSISNKRNRTNHPLTPPPVPKNLHSNKHLEKSAVKYRKAVETPDRHPLATFPVNVPGSPAILSKAHPKRRPHLGKATPLRKIVSKSAISPFVDVDIIVFDDDGRRVSQERRVSRTDVQVNAVGSQAKESAQAKPVRKESKRNAAKKANPIVIESDESDDDFDPPDTVDQGIALAERKRPQRLAARPIVISDISDEDDGDEFIPKPARQKGKSRSVVLTSDSEVESPPLSKRSRNKKAAPAISSSSLVRPVTTVTSSHGPDASQPLQDRVEVVVPPPPTLSHKAVTHSQGATTDDSIPAPCPPPIPSLHEVAHPPAPSRESLGAGHHVPAPRPRQLTPIRPNRSGHLFGHKAHVPHSPPTTSDDLDSSLDLDEEIAKLSISVDSELSALSSSTAWSLQRKQYHAQNARLSDVPPRAIAPSSSVVPQIPTLPTYLQPLLTECSQERLLDFTAFIATFPLDEIHSTSNLPPQAFDVPEFVKIGEASYSEVFGIGDVVLKVVPLRDEDQNAEPGLSVEDTPFLSDAKDVLKEIIVTRAMGEICDGFIKLLRTHVVRGSYPPLLLSLWDEYNDRKGSEGVRPDSFTESQTYAIIILPNGGPDLEAFTFALTPKMGWRQACSTFWQVTRSLSTAEELVRFEHRDLHWGQILVKHTNVPSVPRVKAKVAKSSTPTKPIVMDDPAHGVKATIIDLGLARIDRGAVGPAHDGIYWTPFDPLIFEGEGDYQFDVYRMMKKHNRDSWEEYRPFTNVMWLHYLTLKLLHSKRLRAPTKTARKSLSPGATAAANVERQCYECLIEMEATLAHAVTLSVGGSGKPKGRRKTQHSVAPDVTTTFTCAGDVLAMGRSRGWLEQ